MERQPYPPIDPTTGKMQKVGVPAMRVDWLLPSDVLIPEGVTPSVGWWDEDEGGWNDEDISDIQLEITEDGRILSFSTMHLTALAILQRSAHTAQWSKRPFRRGLGSGRENVI